MAIQFSTYVGVKLHTGFWWGRLRERGHFEKLGVDGKIILKWIFKKWDGAWTECKSEQEQVAGCSECSNEPPGSIEC